LGRYSEALVAYEKAIALDPTNAVYWKNKGGDLEWLNRNSEALIAYEKAIALDPTYQVAIDDKKDLEAKMN
jgi:tetratricopeptide (TPR) repeat protein